METAQFHKGNWLRLWNCVGIPRFHLWRPKVRVRYNNTSHCEVPTHSWWRRCPFLWFGAPHETLLQYVERKKLVCQAIWTTARDILSIIEQNMSSDITEKPGQEISRKANSRWRCWMTTEMKSRKRATAPLRTGSHYTSINFIEVGINRDKWSIGSKCWICKTQEYWTDECQTFLALRLEDRKRIAHESHACFSHACFSCLQAVCGKDHNLNTCRRRKPCIVT